jgi:hypothetical protein
VTEEGIQCRNYGYASIDGALRLYTAGECAALNGNHVPNGECLIKSGGSYSAACAGLNTPAPDAPRAVCDPDSKGALSRDCLISLARGMGYNQSGGILRMLISKTGPNQLDKYALELLQNNGMTVPDAVLGSGAIDKESAGKVYSDLYNAMSAGYSKLTKQAAKWLVSGTDSFDICDFEPDKTGPFPMTCLQREFRQAGCQPAGAAHPQSHAEPRAAKLVKLDILVNNEPVDAFSSIVHPFALCLRVDLGCSNRLCFCAKLLTFSG